MSSHGSSTAFRRGTTVRTAASIGIALIPEHGSRIQELLSHADAAMFSAKATGRNRFHVYSSERVSYVAERLV